MPIWERIWEPVRVRYGSSVIFWFSSWFSSAYASSVGSYSLQLHSYRILRPQLSAHHYSIKQFSEKLHVLQSAVIFKNLDTLRSCFSVQSLCFCIVFLDHVKYLQIHATGATSTLADWHTQKIHACSEVGCRPTTLPPVHWYRNSNRPALCTGCVLVLARAMHCCIALSQIQCPQRECCGPLNA